MASQGRYSWYGIGYGNISVRLNSWKEFYISGSKTGNLAKLDNSHFSKVLEVYIGENSLKCTGPIIASSESMTHAAVYKANKSIGAVIHIHSKPLWDKHKFILPTTAEEIPYGTPEMAEAVYDLVREMGSEGTLIMAGHEEGIISLGLNLEHAYQQLQLII